MPSDPGAGTHLRAGSETTPTCPASAVLQGDRIAFQLSCCPHPAGGLVCLGFPRTLPASCLAAGTPEGLGSPWAVRARNWVHLQCDGGERRADFTPSVYSGSRPPSPSVQPLSPDGETQNHKLGRSNLLRGVFHGSPMTPGV